MAEGMWQFVSTDAQLHPTAQIDQYTRLLEYSAAPQLMEGYYWNDYDALLERAVSIFAVAKETLLLYYYSDEPGTIILIATPIALDVTAISQPHRVELALATDVNSGLITRAGVVTVTHHLFQAAAPLSRR